MTPWKKLLKLAVIEAHFPELHGNLAHRTGRGEGSTAKAAISRAIGHVLRSGKGRRFTRINCTVVTQQ
jgi:hypothetical protein